MAKNEHSNEYDRTAQEFLHKPNIALMPERYVPLTLQALKSLPCH